MRMADEDAIGSGGNRLVDVIDLPNVAWSRGVSFDWIAPRAGEFFLTVSSAQGMIGAYAVTITTLDR